MGWNQKMVNYESGSDDQKSKQEIQGHKATTHHPIDAQFELMGTGVPISLDKATKLPIAEIASLGAVFTSVPQSFRTVTQSIAPAADNLYRVILPEGATGALKAAKEGGSHGFAIIQDGSSKLATLVPADGIRQVTTTVPYDPMARF